MHRTRNSYRRTSWPSLSALLASLGLGKGVKSTSMGVAEDLGADLLAAHHVFQFPKILHVVAKPLTNNSQFLLESLHLATTSATPTCDGASSFSSNCLFRFTRIVLVIRVVSMHRTHFGLPICALSHERNSNAMEPHVEVCHVCPILLRSNPSGVELGNRLIIHVLRYACPAKLFHCF